MDILAIYFILFAVICIKGTWSINLDYESLKEVGVESRIRGDFIDVRVGSTDRTTGGQEYVTNKFIEHPMFMTGEYDYDVAIVVIEEGMKLDGKTVDIIEVYHEPLPGDVITISGWGKVRPEPSDPLSNNLKEADFVILENRYLCQGAPGYAPIITDRHLCAIDKDGINAACDGDPGSPVVDKEGFLVGGVSLFTDCDPAKPLTITRYSDAQIWSFIFAVKNV